MELDQLKVELSSRMPAARFDHVLRVTETAKALATAYDVSVKAAEQAALFHDIAKYMDQEALRLILVEEKLDQRLLLFHHELWHGPAGAIIANREFGVDNQDVLNAIRYHTTGRARMSVLEKVIYVADMIEPGRDFPGVEKLRAIAKENIHQVMEACIHQSVQFLVSKKVPVFPDSIDCYNEHVIQRGIVK